MTTEFYDRTKEVQQFEDSKIGVKGLVDSGVTSIPRFFIHPPETLSDLKSKSTTPPRPVTVPIIDLSGIDSDLLRPTIVENVARASRELGFFQVVNHGIGVKILDRVIGSIKGFHEQPAEVKALLYRRDMNRGLSFFSNIELFHSKAACWRDTMQIFLGPTPPELAEIPEICRNEVVEWNQVVTKLGELLMELLCEGLGVETWRLKERTFLDGKVMVGHYYPPCPQPDQTLGIGPHSDEAALMILLQDHKGGLQFKYGEEWLDVKPVTGALVINIGTYFRSVEHRVLANPSPEPRISAGVLFYASDWDSLFGPFAELISAKKQARFRQFTHTDYMGRFFKREFYGKSLMNHYRLP